MLYPLDTEADATMSIDGFDDLRELQLFSTAKRPETARKQQEKVNEKCFFVLFPAVSGLFDVQTVDD